METIVLDYSDGSVTIYTYEGIDNGEEVEEMLLEKGFRLQDCEWMTTEKILFEKKQI